MSHVIWILATFCESFIVSVIFVTSAIVFCRSKAKTNAKVKDTTSEKTNKKKQSKLKKSMTSPGSKTKSPNKKGAGGGGDGKDEKSDESNGGTTEDKGGGTKADDKTIDQKSKGMQTVPDTLRQKTVDEGGDGAKSCCKGKDQIGTGKEATEDEDQKGNDKCSKGCSSVNKSTLQNTMKSHLSNANPADDGGYDNIGPSGSAPPKHSADSNQPPP